MQTFTIRFINVYTLQRADVCINCTDGTNESKSTGALKKRRRRDSSVGMMIKWEKHDVNAYLLCSGGRWSLRIEEKGWNITRYQVWNIIGTCLYPVHPYLKNKRKK